MKVANMKSPRTGKPVANQFIMTINSPSIYGNFIKRETFQSYNSVIAVKTIWPHEAVKGHGGKEVEIQLDKTYWNYSVTTDKYRNLFLGETKKETQAKIDSGEYKLVDLNKIVPEELFVAVAEVLAYVYKKNKNRRKKRT